MDMEARNPLLPILPLQELATSENLDAALSKEQSDHVGRILKEGYLADKESRKDWEQRMKEANALALQVVTTKSFPWPDASNVKFPLLTVATLQFSARAYSALLRGPEIVKCKVVGQDPQGTKAARATRVSQHLSWQVMEQDENWEEIHDRLLMTVPIVGCDFTKSYFDPVKGHNVTEQVLAQDLVMDYHSRSVKECDRKTHVFKLYPREIRERQLAGIYSDKDLRPVETPQVTDADQRQGIAPPPFWESNTARELGEVHCFLDLDGDRYAEPYVVTLDLQTETVLRIVNRFGKVVTSLDEPIAKARKALATAESDAAFYAAESTLSQLAEQEPKVLRIEPLEYFVKHPFIPAPDGGIYDLGFGALLGPVNESVNTLINQLIDSGTLQNSSSGFIGRGARITGGEMRFKPFEWKKVDVAGGVIRDAIVPLPVNPPSPVLFQLLGVLIQYGERIASVTDTMTGQNPGQNTPAYTSQQMLTQGMAVFSGIFKRLYRSMRNEFRLLYALNARHLTADQYFAILDGPSQQVFAIDYQGDPTDIVPAADPNAVLSEEKQRQSMVLAARAGTVPGYNLPAVERRILEANGINDVQEIFPMDEQGAPLIQPPQNPELEFQREELRLKALELQDKAKQSAADISIKAMLAEAQVELIQAQTIQAYAQAGAIDEKAANDAKLTAIKALDVKRQALKDMQDGKREDRADSAD